jgi:hypothetical protein
LSLNLVSVLEEEEEEEEWNLMPMIIANVKYIDGSAIETNTSNIWKITSGLEW